MDVVLFGPKNPETIRFFEQLNAYEISVGKEVTNLLGFIHSDLSLKGKDFFGYPIFGNEHEVPLLAARGVKFVSLVTGTTVSRYKTARLIVENGGQLTSIIHPSVSILMSKIGLGAYIQESVLIQANVVLGNNCSVHMGCHIAHDTTIGNSSFISFSVAIAGEVEIGDGVFVGANATILPRIKVGKFATIGAGAVVHRDVSDYSIVVGNPARKINENVRELQHGDVFQGS